MPRSRGRKASPPAIRRRPSRWRRLAGGWAEYARNLSLVALTAPFIEPILTNGQLRADKAGVGVFLAIVLLAAATILDNERSDR